MQNMQVVPNEAPSFFKLGACLIYESLVLIAISLVCTAIFVLMLGDSTVGMKRYLLQLFLWLAIGAYFIWCWEKSGQTLPMQTWKLKLVNKKGQLLSFEPALIRYVLASLSLLMLGLGFFWAFIDKDRLFLHDRLLKNRIIYVPHKTSSRLPQKGI